MTTTALDDVPSLTIELCLNGTGALTAASSWTDVTTYVRGFSVQSPTRDRDTGRYNGGSATLILDNRDRRFDPSYTSGPYYPNLKPRIQGRIRATWSAVTSPITYFYADAIPQSLPQGMYDAEVPISASDGFRLLNSLLPRSVWAYELLTNFVGGGGSSPYPGSVWYPCSEQGGTIMGDASGNGIHGRWEGGATFNHRQSLLPYSGQGDGAIEFNGGDMAGVADDPAVNLITAGGAWSVLAWIKLPDALPASGYDTIARADISGGGGMLAGWTLRLDSSGYLNYSVKGIASDLKSDSPLSAGRVYFVSALQDGVSGSLYVNASLQSATTAADTAWQSTVKNSLYVGGLNAGTTEASWSGTIGDFVYTAGALAGGDTDVQTLYDAGTDPWSGDTTGTRVGRLATVAGFPIGLRDIDTGLSTLGAATLSGTVLDVLQRLAKTESGLLHMAPDGDLTLVDRTAQRSESRFTTSAGTFSDRTGTLLYEDVIHSGYDDESIYNVARCSRDGGAIQEYRDATSVSLYGERVWDGTGLFFSTDGEALDRATYEVVRRKDPAVRVQSITLRPRGTTALWPHVLGRLIGDRITVEVNPLQLGATSSDYFITGITHTISDVYTISNGGVGFDWLTTWTLEPTDPLEASWAIAGSGAAKNQCDTCKASY